MGTQARRRNGIAAAVALAGIAATVAAAPAARAASPSGPASGICVVKHVDGVQRAKVKVGVDIANARSSATRHARCGVVAKVVRGLASAGAEMPQKVARYRCTPTVTGSKVAWTCRFRGGHPRTTVQLDFAYRYVASDQRRG
jgi:hypothetical protein